MEKNLGPIHLPGDVGKSVVSVKDQVLVLVLFIHYALRTATFHEQIWLLQQRQPLGGLIDQLADRKLVHKILFGLPFDRKHHVGWQDLQMVIGFSVTL